MRLAPDYMLEKDHVEKMYSGHIGHRATLVSSRQLADDLFFDVISANPNQPTAYLRVHTADGFYLFQALVRS